MRNLGPGRVEPAAHVNRQFGLAGAAAGTLLSVDRTKRCGAAPSSYARAVARRNPEDDQKPGQETETVALYAAPSSGGRLAWTAPGLDVRVPLGGLTASGGKGSVR